MKKIVKKKSNGGGRTLRVFSRHPSHAQLRDKITLPFLACIRFGSTNAGTLPYAVEINSTESIRNSSSKRLMKECFQQNGVKTADWYTTNDGKMFDGNNVTPISELPYPIVAKHVHGSRGEGNYLLKTQEELNTWLKGKTLNNYIFERYTPFVREYRLHLSALGCFYACRKMLREGTPENEKWHRHDTNSVWIREENELFDKPCNWDAIVAEGVKAIAAVGLDVGCIDLRVQSARDSKDRVRENPEFFVIETNSAPSFGEITYQKYLENIPMIAKNLFVKK